jgi:integrase
LASLHFFSRAVGGNNPFRRRYLPKSAVADWQRSFRRLFYMFRDTFAVEMLLAGVPIDQVSILLGHYPRWP